MEGGQRLVVRDRHVLGAVDVLQPRVFRTDARVIQAGRDGMRLDDLAVLVLQQIGAVAVQNTREAGRERRRVLAGVDALARRLDADELHARLVDVRVEDAHRVRAAADAGDDVVRLAARHLRHLHAAFLADHGLEVAHHHRVRVRARDRADDVEGVFDVRDPVAHRFVERVLQRLRTRFDRHDGRAQELHAVDVLRLALDVLAAHVDHAFEAEARADGRRGHAVLAGARLGDDARLAHAPGEQRLADHVVDFVGARVVQVFALEEDLRTAALFGPALGVVHGRRTADEVRQLVAEFFEEFGILAVAGIRLVQLGQRVAERLGDERAAVRAEVAGGVRQLVVGGLEQRLGAVNLIGFHDVSGSKRWHRRPAPPRRTRLSCGRP